MVVILNPAAGTQRTAAPGILRAFARRGLPARVARTRTPADSVEWARRAVGEGARAVVAAGGDGTVSAVASVVAGSGVPFGVLPLGTGNHFARDLRLPMNLDAAVAVIASSQAAAVDVCEVNGRVFVNNASLGLYPALVAERESREQAGYRRWSAFLWALATALRRFSAPVLRLQVNGREMVRRAPVVFVGNNRYLAEGLRMGRRENLSAGEMCVFVWHQAGRLPGLRQFDGLCARELWIHSRRRHLPVALDGEVVTLAPPLHYRVRPGALRVLVPGD